MKSILDAYWSEIRTKFTQMLVWLPGTPMDLGDIGVLERNGWTKVTTLADLGITSGADTEGAESDYDYMAGATVSATASGVLNGAGLVVNFHRGGAFMLKASAVRVHRLDKLDVLSAQILRLHASQQWNRD